MGSYKMKAMVNNHLVELIEKLASDLWLVLDTETGKYYEVEESSLYMVEY